MFKVEESAKQGRKWVDRELLKMNPETDYAQMMAMQAEYAGDEFSLNLLAVSTNLHVIMPRHGAETQAFTGKTIRRPNRRTEDSMGFFWTWLANGPEHPETIASVQRLNKIHLGVAKHLPGNFAKDSDFIYTFGMLSISGHRLLKKLGLGGLPPHMQTATHHFMQGVAKHMVREDGQPVVGFPKDFAALEAYCDDWEHWDHEYTPVATDLANALIGTFVHRWFPRPLQRMGRAMVLYTMQDHVVAHLRLKPLGPVSRLLTHWMLKGMFAFQIHVKADRKVSSLEQRQPLSSEEILQKDREAVARADQAGWTKGGRVALGRQVEGPAPISMCPVPWLHKTEKKSPQ